MQIEPTHEVPAEVQERLNSWKRGRQIMGTTAHNLLGLLGILGSLVALTGLPGVWTKGATIVTGFAIAAMTMWNPRREYIKFARAWRVLDAAARNYRYGLATLPQLFDAVALGEAIIEEADALAGDSSADMLGRSLNHSRALNASSRPPAVKRNRRPRKAATAAPSPSALPPDQTNGISAE